MSQPFKTVEIEDAVESFEQGMNAGIEPLLLPKNQLAFARNGTLRGLFLLPRPPYQKITLNYNAADPGIQQRVETGLWQGAAYYKPDVGPECLLASISGNLYQFIVVGGVASVFDVTGGNAQSSTASQCWIWQSEKWAIWNDGLNLPVFFDGGSTRRSLGASAVVATTNGAPTIPAVGAVVTINLTSNYTGPTNVPVRIDGLLYQILTSGTLANAYQIVVTTRYISSGTTEASGATIITKPGTIGYVTSSVPSFTVQTGQTADRTISVSDTSLTPTAGTNIKFGAYAAQVLSASGLSITARFSGSSLVGGSGGGGSTTFNITAGSVVTIPSNTQPSVTIGNLSAAFTIPAVGASGTMSLASAYVGGTNSTVIWVGSNQYAVTATVGGTVATAINAMLLSSPNGKTTIATGTSVFSIAELPAGRSGEYGKGRNWISLTDGRSYLAGDIVGGPSGTPAYNYRDAVLKVAENSYLAGGGVFTVPGPGGIRSMRFPAQLDQSLGQGDLQVGTTRDVFSCNAPVDRSTWQSVTNPLQTRSLVGYGPVSHYGTVIWNGDLMFRSRDGIRSLILARRDFASWGNTPISNELSPFVSTDDPTLLPFCSAIVFDNRMLMTLSPVDTGQGTYFTKLAVLNGDPISSLRGKGQSIYDGIWDGLNVLQLVAGQFNEKDRAFAFNLNTTTSAIELYELLPTGTNHFDNGTTKIVQEYELPVMRFQTRGRDPHDLIRLIDGELYADSLDGSVLFEVFFRPDYDPNYHPWYSWTVDTANQAVWQPKMGLGEPPIASDPSSLRPNREGYVFQLKVRVTGYARILGARCKAVTIPETKYAPQVRN